MIWNGWGWNESVYRWNRANEWCEKWDDHTWKCNPVQKPVCWKELILKYLLIKTNTEVYAFMHTKVYFNRNYISWRFSYSAMVSTTSWASAADKPWTPNLALWATEKCFSIDLAASVVWEQNLHPIFIFRWSRRVCVITETLFWILYGQATHW